MIRSPCKYLNRGSQLYLFLNWILHLWKNMQNWKCKKDRHKNLLTPTAHRHLKMDTICSTKTLIEVSWKYFWASPLSWKILCITCLGNEQVISSCTNDNRNHVILTGPKGFYFLFISCSTLNKVYQCVSTKVSKYEKVDLTLQWHRNTENSGNLFVKHLALTELYLKSSCDKSNNVQFCR